MSPDDVSRETSASATAGKWRDQVRRALGTGEPPVTWRDYQDIVTHARHEYLAAVQAARNRREAVSAPAFEQFAAAERLAWFKYHETGHRAWNAYQEAQRDQPPPPAERRGPPCEYPNGCKFNSGCDGTCAYAARAPESVTGALWPASPYDHPQPVFTPQARGNAIADQLGVPRPYPEPDDNPESGQ